MTQKPGEYNMFVNIWADFAKIRSRMHYVPWPGTYWSGQRSRSYQAM